MGVISGHRPENMTKKNKKMTRENVSLEFPDVYIQLFKQLFIVFNTSFGGVPAKAYTSDGDSESSECMTYSSMVSYVRDLLKGDSITIHWR